MMNWLKKLFCKTKEERACPFYDCIFGECGNCRNKDVSASLRTDNLHCIDNKNCHYRKWKRGECTNDN